MLYASDAVISKHPVIILRPNILLCLRTLHVGAHSAPSLCLDSILTQGQRVEAYLCPLRLDNTMFGHQLGYQMS